MFKLVAKVAIDGELLQVMEAPVFEVRARRRARPAAGARCGRRRCSLDQSAHR